jgi:polyhydroxyalkanoate synthesis repressor PhaR
VTLEELEEMIRAGKEIRVTDASTGEDLTSVTLAQILLENERAHRATLPTALLHQLIKHGEAWQDFAQRSLRASLEGVITSQRDADRVFKDWASKAGWLPSQEREPEVRKGREEKEKAKAESLREEVATLKEKLRAVERRIPRKRKK